MKIALLAPFFSGSHRRWAEEYARFSEHEIRLLTLPGRHWKWRMHGAAVSLAGRLREEDDRPDLILTTDMLDVAVLRGLLGPNFADVPVAVYFHENQLTYPWSPTDEDVHLQRDRHYAWINYTTALAADAVFFNSAYHQERFLKALPAFLNAFPDHQELQSVEWIAAKSQVLPLGMDLAEMDQYRPAAKPEGAPVLLWNHRWEYDKNPEAFFQLCFRLQDEGLAFRLVVLGEQYRHSPAIFKEARPRLEPHLLHWGFAPDAATYYRWLWQADILPVTSRQDFFGGSVVEAMYCGCYPLLPDRLAYPEHLPGEWADEHLYQSSEALYEKLADLLRNPDRLRSSQVRNWVQGYDWRASASVYDLHLTSLINECDRCA